MRLQPGQPCPLQALRRTQWMEDLSVCHSAFQINLEKKKKKNQSNEGLGPAPQAVSLGWHLPQPQRRWEDPRSLSCDITGPHTKQGGEGYVHTPLVFPHFHGGRLTAPLTSWVRQPHCSGPAFCFHRRAFLNVLYTSFHLIR